MGAGSRTDCCVRPLRRTFQCSSRAGHSKQAILLPQCDVGVALGGKLTGSPERGYRTNAALGTLVGSGIRCVPFRQSGTIVKLTILRACRFPPRSIDHQSGFHGICGSTCLAIVNRHGHSPSHRVTVDQFTLPRYLSSHASTARDRSGRSWLTSCGVSSTMWRLSPAGVPSIRNIGS